MSRVERERNRAIPEARIGLGFGNFVKVNAVILQSKTAKSGATTFRY